MNVSDHIPCSAGGYDDFIDEWSIFDSFDIWSKGAFIINILSLHFVVSLYNI